MKIPKEQLPLCRPHRLAAWQAAIDERGHGATKRSIFVPICRECRKALIKSVRKRLMTLVAARELARAKNAVHILPIAAKARATRLARRAELAPARNSVIAEAMAQIDVALAMDSDLEEILEGRNPTAEALAFRFSMPPV